MLKAQSVSVADYSVALELVTSKMAERPFMRPAAKKVRPKAVKLMQLAVNRVINGGTL